MFSLQVASPCLYSSPHFMFLLSLPECKNWGIASCRWISIAPRVLLLLLRWPLSEVNSPTAVSHSVVDVTAHFKREDRVEGFPLCRNMQLDATKSCTRCLLNWTREMQMWQFIKIIWNSSSNAMHLNIFPLEMWIKSLHFMVCVAMAKCYPSDLRDCSPMALFSRWPPLHPWVQWMSCWRGDLFSKE